MELRKAVDYLCLYDPDFEGYAKRSQTDWGGSSDIYQVMSMACLKMAINSYTNVKFLEIALHGKPGLIKFADKGAMNGYLLGNLAQGTAFLQREARILFDSCRIAQDETFMDKLGKSMLTGKGGIIGAPTDDTFVYYPKFQFGRGFHLEADSARLIVNKYDINGERANGMVVDGRGKRY